MESKLTSVSVVLVGRFRPADFLPAKLAERKALSQSDAAKASYQVLIPDQVIHYSVGWGTLRVNDTKLHVETIEAPYVRACDLAISSLTTAARECSVVAFGINCEAHYDVGSVDARNELGLRLAPPSAWGAWGDEIKANMGGSRKGTPLQSGVLSLQMRNPFSENGIEGTFDVTIGPSLVIPDSRGVYFRSNRHHQAAPLTFTPDVPNASGKDANRVTEMLIEALSETFDRAVDDAKRVFDGVLTS